MTLNRREFLFSAASAATGLALGVPRTLHASAAAQLRFGYASITWSGDDLRAIDEIASQGFPGIQLRSNVLTRFGNQPGVLRDLLQRRGLTMVAFSSGNVTLDAATRARMIAERVSHAKFVRDVGGLFLQVTDERPRGRPVNANDCSTLGQLLSEIGRKTADVGVQLVYHNHMGAIGEKPDDVDRILAAADPGNVKLLLDIAHYHQGGGDPAAVIRSHGDRLAMLHLKDVEPVAGAQAGASSYRFVELGRGRVNLDAVFATLDEIRFAGWGVVELDAVTARNRSASASAAINRMYLESRGLQIRA